MYLQPYPDEIKDVIQEISDVLLHNGDHDA